MVHERKNRVLQPRKPSSWSVYHHRPSRGHFRRPSRRFCHRTPPLLRATDFHPKHHRRTYRALDSRGRRERLLRPSPSPRLPELCHPSPHESIFCRCEASEHLINLWPLNPASSEFLSVPPLATSSRRGMSW